ncbi:Hypothetical protein NTJ_15660 [Nesidiocoris tenuis]|uniref:Tudor domain-containing protein n=2 Tax=Nesidiocoris tenuis TaxID=355587 RepID=A0ABN7BHQ8_9HEMI|nr:Hypothetical protein NTJ_15660 [Nesidiocoris tenuis]
MRVDAGGARAGGPLAELDVVNYTFSGWKEWLVLFRRRVGPSFNNFSNAKKVSTLLAKLGPNARHIFESFDAGDVSYSELLNLFEEYFSTVKGRVAFYRRAQKGDEDFTDFADALTALSCVCGFGPCQDEVVRDVFVTNLHHRYDRLREDLLKLTNPTMEEVISRCKALSDTSIESPLDLKSDDHISENIVSESEIKCERTNSQIAPTSENNELDANVDKIADGDRLNSQALKDISNCTDSFGNSDGKHSQSGSLKNGVHDVEPESADSSGEESGKHGNTSGKSDKTGLPNLYRRKMPSDLEGTKMVNGNRDSNLSQGNDKNLLKCADVPKTSVSSRLWKFSNGQQDRQTTFSNIEKDELAYTETVSRTKNEGDNSKRNSTPTSLTQFMKKCQEISLSNSTNTEGKSKFLSSGTITSCRIDFSAEDSTKPDKIVPSDSSISGPDKCQSPSITSSTEESAPIPSSRFTDITVVYIPEEGDRVYACSSAQIPFMQRLEVDLKSRADILENVETPVPGGIYAAPWGDDWYRARVVDKSGDVVEVVFCDYGNVEDIKCSMLKRLPQQYEDEPPLAFPVRPPKTCSDIVFAGQLKVKPVRFTAGAWEIEVDMTGMTDS